MIGVDGDDEDEAEVRNENEWMTESGMDARMRVFLNLLVMIKEDE